MPPRKKRRWRLRLPEWSHANLEGLLGSTRGEARLHDVVTEVARRLGLVLFRLDEGVAVVSDPSFASALQHAVSWLAFQEDVTVKGARLRAYCDITASVTLLNLLIREMAAELSLDGIDGQVDVALRLADATGNWREPLVVAGRHRLAAGQIDDAVAFARRALNAMSACPESQRLLMDALRERQRAGGAIDGVGQNGLADLRGRFCPRPFEVLVSSQSLGWNAETNTTEQVMGSSYLCDCAAWLPFIAGNVVEADSADSVWNSEGAQEIRRSIFDGDYSYCSRTMCPAIVNDALPRMEDVTAPRLRRIIDNRETVLPDAPRLIALGHDSSCNLACPSCRVELVMANKTQSEKLDRARDRVILPLLRNNQVGVHLTAWGDPFASRHYRSILEALRDDDFKDVSLSILTNGLGLTPHVWTTMPHLAEKIVELRVSIDAATKETYENVRRPGRWDVLMENLKRMGELNRAGTFGRNRLHNGVRWVNTDLAIDNEIAFALAFVVQSANFREMPAFVELTNEVGADAIVFQKYYSLGHEDATVFASKDVTSPAHPEHSALQEILAHPFMQDSKVLQMFVSQLAEQAPS